MKNQTKFMAIVGATLIGFMGGKISTPQSTQAEKIPHQIHGNCIRLEDIDSWHINAYGYISFDLSDTTHQLEDENLPSYTEMLKDLPYDKFLSKPYENGDWQKYHEKTGESYEEQLQR